MYKIFLGFIFGGLISRNIVLNSIKRKIFLDCKLDDAYKIMNLLEKNNIKF